MQNTLRQEVLPAAPPVAVSGLTLAGWQMSDVVLALTAVYTLFQIVRIVPKVIGCFSCCIQRRRLSCDGSCKEG